MKTFSFYHKDTGIFSGLHITCVSIQRAVNRGPPDHECIAGNYSPRIHRYDIKSGTIVEERPPAPTTDHEWNESQKLWLLPREIVKSREAQRIAKENLAVLDQSELRALSDLLASIDLGDQAARSRLLTVRDKKDAERAKLVGAAQTPGN